MRFISMATVGLGKALRFNETEIKARTAGATETKVNNGCFVQLVTELNKQVRNMRRLSS